MSSAFITVMSKLANANLVPFIFALIIGIPSALLYCLELWILINNFSKFKSAFFVLVGISGILSLVNWVFAFLGHHFGKIGLFLSIYLQLPQIVLAFIIFVIFYANHVENLLTAMLLLNRFTSIFWPILYKMIWRYALVPVLLAIFILPLPFTIPIFNLDVYIHVQNDNATFSLDNYNKANVRVKKGDANLIDINDANSNSLVINGSRTNSVVINDVNSNSIKINDGKENSIHVKDANSNSINIKVGNENSLGVNDGNSNSIGIKDGNKNWVDVTDGSSSNSIGIKNGTENLIGIKNGNSNSIDIKAAAVNANVILIDKTSENSVVINDGRANTIKINDGKEHSIEINDDLIMVNDQRIQNEANANDHQHEDGANSIVIEEGRTNSVVINNGRANSIEINDEHIVVNGQLIRNEARSQQIRNRAGNLRNMQVSIINGQLIINGRHISAEQWNLGDLRRSNIVVTNGHVTINGRHLP